MDNARDLVHEIGQIGLEHIRVVDKLVDLANHEDSIDLSSWDHNLQVSITRRHLISYYACTKLTKGHLKQISDPKDSLLQLNRLHLALLLSFMFIVKLRWLRFIQRIICKRFDNSDHLCDWVDDQVLRVVCEHDSAGTKNEAGEDRGEELKHSLLLTRNFDAEPCVRNEFITVFDCPIQTLLGRVSQQLQFLRPQIAFPDIIDVIT